MYNTALSHLDAVLDDRRPFRFSKCLSEGINIWQKEALMFIAFTLIYLVINLGLNIIIILGPLAILILIGPAFSLGYFIYSYRTQDNKHRELSTFFDGFKFSKEIAVSGLLKIVLWYFFISITSRILGFSVLTLSFLDTLKSFSFIQTTGLYIFSFCIISLLVFYIFICTSLIPFLIGFFELDAINAIKYGFIFGTRYYFSLLFYFILAVLLATCGLFLFVFGFVVSLSLFFPIIYAAFEDITDLEGYYADDSEDDIKIDDMFGA